MPHAVSQRRLRRRVACLLGALTAMAGVAAGAPPTASATHHPAHVCAKIDFSGGERCMPDPLNPDEVRVGDDVCLGGEIVSGCYVATTQDVVDATCVNLILQTRCPYREVRAAAGQPEIPGKPTVSAASVTALLGSLDCVVTEAVLNRRGIGGVCRHGSGSRHHFYDCSLPGETWCIYNVRHSYNYGTAAFDRQGSNDSVYVCVKFIRDSDGGRIAMGCGYQFVELAVGSDPLKKPLVYNGNRYRRTIAGYARF